MITITIPFDLIILLLGTSTYKNPCTQANVVLKKTSLSFAPTACEDTFCSWVVLSLGWSQEQIPWLHWTHSDFKSFRSHKSWNSFSNLKELSHNFRPLSQPRLAPQWRHLSFPLLPSFLPPSTPLTSVEHLLCVRNSSSLEIAGTRKDGWLWGHQYGNDRDRVKGQSR